MWFPAAVTEPPSDEPVSLADARLQCGVIDSDTSFDTRLSRLIRAARERVENYCGLRIPPQTVAMSCDCWSDLARLSEAPCISLISISYVAGDGSDVTLPEDMVVLHPDGIEPRVVLASGASWPSRLAGSRITVAANVGFEDVPSSLCDAMLMHISRSFDEPAGSAWSGRDSFDNLLSDWRRGR